MVVTRAWNAGSGVLDVVLRGAYGRVGAIDAAVVCDAFVPGLLVHDKLQRLGQRDDWFFLAEVVGLRRRLHLLQFSLLLRVLGKGGFVGLVRAGPQGGAYRNRIIVDGGEL